MSTIKKNQFEIKILDIVQRTLSINDFPLKKTVKVEDQIDIKLKFTINLDVDKDIVDFRLNLSLELKKSNQKVSELETSIIFLVKGLNKHVKDNKFITNIIPITIASISFSTFRGVVSETFRGTQFKNMSPLPIIDPKLFFEQLPPE